MEAQSDTKPERFIKSRGKTQFAYNIHQVTIEDPESKIRTVFEYDYVEIENKITKAKIIKALEDAELELEEEFDPSEIESTFKEVKEAIKLSDITKLTYKELDTYIDNPVTLILRGFHNKVFI
jgi:hypothetical protein